MVTFRSPPITVSEVGKCIYMMENTKSIGLDGINPFLLKLALPYVVQSLTYVYNLYISSNIIISQSSEECKSISSPNI